MLSHNYCSKQKRAKQRGNWNHLTSAGYEAFFFISLGKTLYFGNFTCRKETMNLQGNRLLARRVSRCPVDSHFLWQIILFFICSLITCSQGNQQCNINFTVMQIWQHALLYKVPTTTSNTMPGAWHINHAPFTQWKFSVRGETGNSVSRKKFTDPLFCLSTGPPPCIQDVSNPPQLILSISDVCGQALYFGLLHRPLV